MGHHHQERTVLTQSYRRSLLRFVLKGLCLCGALALCSVWSTMAQDTTSAVKACLVFPSPGAGTCYPSLSQAEAALNKDPTYGPSYQRAYTESANSSEVVIIYHVKDRPAETLYPPNYVTGLGVEFTTRAFGCPAALIPSSQGRDDLMTPDESCVIHVLGCGAERSRWHTPSF